MANLIKGDAVANATSYTLHKKATTDAEIVATPVATQNTGGPISFNLDTLVETSDTLGYGTFQFAVKAHADGYLSSDYSNLSEEFEIPDRSIMSLDAIKESTKEWKNTKDTMVGTISSAGTLETDCVAYTPDSASSIVAFSTMPLNVGSEIDCTVSFPRPASNVCLGFNQDVSEMNRWEEMAWKTGQGSSIRIPDSHIWFTADGSITYLERGSSKYRTANPGKKLTAAAENTYRVKLKVLADGFEVYQGSGSEPVFTMTKAKSNPYLTHTATPVYFCMSTVTEVSLKIHSIKKL